MEMYLYVGQNASEEKKNYNFSTEEKKVSGAISSNKILAYVKNCSQWNVVDFISTDTGHLCALNLLLCVVH